MTTIDSYSFTYDALSRRVEYGTGSSFTQYLYAPFDATLNLGAALAHASPSLRIPTPGGGQAILGASGVTDYRRPNWQQSQPIDSSTTRTALSDASYSAYGEHYAENGYSGFFAGNLSIFPVFMDGYAATWRLYHYDQTRWVSPDPAGLSAVDPSDPQTWNRYSYARGNPLGTIDPSGLDGNCQSYSGTYSNGVFWITVYCSSYVGGITISQSYNIGASQSGGSAGGSAGGSTGSPKAPNNGIANNARCAAANASSIASLVGIGKENWFGQALLGNDIATFSNLAFGPGRLSSAGQAALSSPLKYNAVNHIAGHFGAMDSGTGRWLNIGSVDEFGDPTAVFKGLWVAETAAGKAISEAAGVFTAAKLVFDTGAYAYAYAKCAGAIH